MLVRRRLEGRTWAVTHDWEVKDPARFLNICSSAFYSSLSQISNVRSVLSAGRTMLPLSSLCRGVRFMAQQHVVALECCSVLCTRASSSSCPSSLHVPPPACMLRPLEVPYRYLFGPGPSNVSPRVLAAGGRPIIGHLHPEMYEVRPHAPFYLTR